MTLSPFWRRNSNHRDDRSIRKHADTARDAGRWALAAQLYERAATSSPTEAIGLWIQAGNCAKEAHQFVKSLEFYERARKALLIIASTKRDTGWIATTGDLSVQMGHLFKVSGNFSAAKCAYTTADALGDNNGRAELGEFDRFLPDIAWPSTVPQANGPPAAAFHSICKCELNPTDPDLLRVASLTLFEWTDAHDLARAYAELAFLCDGTSEAAKHHQALIAQTLRQPLPLISPTLHALAAPNARAHLRHAVSDLLKLTDVVSLSPATARSHDTGRAARRCGINDPYFVLKQPAAIGLAQNLQAGIGKAHAAVWGWTNDLASQLAETIEALLVAVRPTGTLITFHDARTSEALCLFATRVLNEVVNAWLSKISVVRYGGKCDHAQLAVRFVHGEALRIRRRELGGPVALYAELETLLYAAVDEPVRRESTMVSLVGGDPEGISPTEAQDVLNRIDVGPNVTRTLLAIGFRDATEPRQIVDYAQALKDRGLLKDAAEVLTRLDETMVSDDLLIEKAIVAKAVGDYRQAARILERCYKNAPSDFLRSELAMVLPEVEPIDAILHRYAGDSAFFEIAHSHAAFIVARSRRARSSLETVVRLAPELAAPAFSSGLGAMLEGDRIEVLGLGAGEHATPLGRVPILRPIEFVRVRVASREPVQRLRVRIDGRTVTECIGSVLTNGYENSTYAHQMFNAWFETTGLAPGAHALQLYFEEARGGYRMHDRTVWVESRDWATAGITSPAIIAHPPVGEGSIDQRIQRLDTERFDADRSYFVGTLDRILVMRADQLGDTVLSLPAVAALRRHFSEARIDALVSSAQVDLARASSLFDGVFGIDFPYDPIARRRLLSLENQKWLTAQLAPHHYDLAIDLSPGDQTRPLLKLAGARYTAGFKPERFPWLDVALDLRTHDHGNRQEGMPHARAPLALIEAIAVAALGRPMNLPNAPLDPVYRRTLGLTEGERYAVFHSGARTASRKWPLDRYLDVARSIINRYGLRVVLMLDDSAEFQDVPADLAQGLVVLRDKPTFAQFDGLLSNCTIFLGNDTGPKHLAALRGAPVVSIHMGAVNWSEWAQDGSGLVLTRRVPCYGCGIEFAEECGRNLPCLFDISVSDAVSAIDTLLSRQGYNV